MDNEEARFLLSACQPSGKDAGRPEIAEALAQAQLDPELNAWLARERRSDAAIAHKLRALEPDPNLRARLLAGGRASRRALTWRTWRLGFGLAATVALATGLGWWAHGLVFKPSATAVHLGGPPLLAWQQHDLVIFLNPFFSLDLEKKNYQPLEAHLVAAAAPVAGELPFNDAIVSAVGCKVLEWHGDRVSLTCFLSKSGELVHLFVAPRGNVDESLLQHGPHRAQVGAYATVTWLRGDHIVMVASKLPADQLERTLIPRQLAIGALPLVPRA